MRWLRRVSFWIRRHTLADELREEMETHRSMREHALRDRGLSPADAAAASRRAMGNVALARDDARDVWIGAAIGDLTRDIRFAMRGLRRQPGFAAAAIVTIAVGTGALASVLSVLDAVLYRDVPYPNAGRIVQVSQVVGARTRDEVAPVDIQALRAGVPALSHVTLAWLPSASLTGDAADSLPERARLVYTDAAAFPMLGTQPILGRLPGAADEAPDAPPIALLGHALWQRRFAGDPNVVGRTLRINGEVHTIIGVMPESFRFPGPYWSFGELWTLRDVSHPSWPGTRSQTMLAFARLADGATMAQAQTQADVVAASLDARFPEQGAIGLRLTDWAAGMRAESRPRLLLVLGAATVLFLIVCVNLVNLLLGRGIDRQREIAARMALGAGRRRIVRQLLTETCVLFAIGGVVGLLLALWGTSAIVALRSYNIPRMEEASLSPVVAAASMGAVLVAALVVGLAPALQASWSGGLLNAGVRGASRGRSWRRVQRALIAIEVALALVLVCGAGVMLEGGRRLARVSPGFDPAGLLHFRVSLPPERYAAEPAQTAFHERATEALAHIPGVTAIGIVDVPPGVGGTGAPAVLLDGDPEPAVRADLRRADVRVARAGYFEALGLRPLAGRFLTSGDGPSAMVAVVNETFVRRFFDGRDAIGRRIRVATRGLRELDRAPRTIIGVMPDLREHTVYAPVPPAVYVPASQGDARRMAILLRSDRTQADLVPLARRAIADADPEIAPNGFMGFSDLIRSELSLNYLNLRLLGVLAVVSVLLAIVGVYGVTAHAVRQRTREIGIRLALGMTPRGIGRLVLGEGTGVVAIGLLVGGAAAVWSAGVLRSLVHGIDRTSPLTFAAAAVLLALAVAAGCYIPARRASRIDPASVLRSD